MLEINDDTKVHQGLGSPEMLKVIQGLLGKKLMDYEITQESVLLEFENEEALIFAAPLAMGYVKLEKKVTIQ